MKKFILIMLFAAACFAGTISISTLPDSLTAQNGIFNFSFSVNCAPTVNTTCNDTIHVFYSMTFGIEKKNGWEIESIEKNTRAANDADCVFSTQRSACQYNPTFDISSSAVNQKVKVVIQPPSNWYQESKWISVNNAVQQTLPENNSQPVVQLPQNQSTPTEQNTAPEKETDIFDLVWKWLLGLIGIK